MASELLHIDTTATGTEAVMAIAGEFDLSTTESFGVCVGAVLDHHPGRSRSTLAASHSSTHQVSGPCCSPVVRRSLQAYRSLSASRRPCS